MPRSRKGGKARTYLTLDSFNAYEYISFWTGMPSIRTPFDRSKHRWGSVEDFLGDYEQVRDQVLALTPNGPTPAAERTLQERGGTPAKG
jgi:hypothetical protein